MKEASAEKLNWDGLSDLYVDIRLFFVFKTRSAWAPCRYDPADESLPKFWRISTFTKRQICYTPESLKYTQTAFFISVVVS